MKALLFGVLLFTVSAPAAFAKPDFSRELACAQGIEAFDTLTDSGGTVAYSVGKSGNKVVLYAITPHVVYEIPTPARVFRQGDPSIRSHFYQVKLPSHNVAYIWIQVEGDEVRMEMVMNEHIMPRHEKLPRYRATNPSKADPFWDRVTDWVRTLKENVTNLRGLPEDQFSDLLTRNFAWEERLKTHCAFVPQSELNDAINEALVEFAKSRAELVQIKEQKLAEEKVAPKTIEAVTPVLVEETPNDAGVDAAGEETK